MLLNTSNAIMKESHRTTASYYHHVDSRYPICPFSLPQIYEMGAMRDDGRGFTWHRPAERMSHKQVYDKAMLFAKGLLALGLKRGDNLCSFGVPGSDSLVMFVACTSLGIIFSAPYMFAPISKVVEMYIRRLEPRLICVGNIHSGADWEHVFTVCQGVMTRNRASSGYQVPHVFYDTHAEKDPTCTHESGWAQPLSELIKSGETITDDELNEAKSLVGLNEPVMYTLSSGSTGEPKLILNGAAIFTNGGIRKISQWGTNEESVYGCHNMCSDEIALVEELCASFYIGYNVIIFPQPTTLITEGVVTELLDVIQTHRPMFCYIDQYYTSYIINHPECRRGYDLSSLKGWNLSGSCLSIKFKLDALALWPETIDNYGLTENYYCISPRPGDNVLKVDSIGKPFPNVEVKIVDDKGRIVPRNTPGELYIRSYGHFIEYQNLPELTQSAKTVDGWFKTGDCAIMDDENDIKVVGRMTKAERFKVSTDVVYAAPIENILKGNKKIKEVAVIGRPAGSAMGHEIIYCIVPFHGVSLTAEEVFDFAKEHMHTQNEWPARVFFCEKFPRHGSRSKITRTALVEIYQKMVEADPCAGQTALIADLVNGHPG